MHSDDVDPELLSSKPATRVVPHRESSAISIVKKGGQKLPSFSLMTRIWLLVDQNWNRHRRKPGLLAKKTGRSQMQGGFGRAGSNGSVGLQPGF